MALSVSLTRMERFRLQGVRLAVDDHDGSVSVPRIERFRRGRPRAGGVITRAFCIPYADRTISAELQERGRLSPPESFSIPYADRTISAGLDDHDGGRGAHRAFSIPYADRT